LSSAGSSSSSGAGFAEAGFAEAGFAGAGFAGAGFAAAVVAAAGSVFPGIWASPPSSPRVRRLPVRADDLDASDAQIDAVAHPQLDPPLLGVEDHVAEMHVDPGPKLVDVERGFGTLGWYLHHPVRGLDGQGELPAAVVRGRLGHDHRPSRDQHEPLTLGLPFQLAVRPISTRTPSAVVITARAPERVIKRPPSGKGPAAAGRLVPSGSTRLTSPVTNASWA
jgi:hypothetical protein